MPLKVQSDYFERDLVSRGGKLLLNYFTCKTRCVLGVEQTSEGDASRAVHGEDVLSIVGLAVLQAANGQQVIGPFLSCGVQLIVVGHWGSAVLLPVIVVGLKELLLELRICTEKKVKGRISMQMKEEILCTESSSLFCL